MGKGDKKTRKGEIFINSYGKLRPRRGKFRVRPEKIKNPQEKEIA